MKIDRLLEIIIYLFNHDKVSAKKLAEHFQVSVRTIQRNMVSISVAGIPVYAAEGKNGGYSILPLAVHYKWYAWYLFGWSPEGREYRTCKVARIRDLEVTDEISDRDHGDIEARMKESEQAYYQTCIPIEIHFYEESAGLMEEYREELIQTAKKFLASHDR